MDSANDQTWPETIVKLINANVFKKIQAFTDPQHNLGLEKHSMQSKKRQKVKECRVKCIKYITRYKYVLNYESITPSMCDMLFLSPALSSTFT